MLPHGESPDKPWGLIIAFIIFIIAIVASGMLFYQYQEEQIKTRVTSDLSSIATLKADHIAVWRGERLGDATVLSENRFFVDGVRDYLATPDPTRRQIILTLFGQITSSYPYRNVQLTDRKGRVQLSLDPSGTTLTPVLEEQPARSLSTRTAVLTDLSFCPDGSTPQMYAIAPLMVTENGKTDIVGVVILTIDSARTLYPFIQSWPVPSSTAETLLVEQERDHVLYLNELRHRKNTALKLSIPLSQKDVPAVMAVLGTTWVFTGTDYRGVEAISVLRPIPGSP